MRVWAGRLCIVWALIGCATPSPVPVYFGPVVANGIPIGGGRILTAFHVAETSRAAVMCKAKPVELAVILLPSVSGEDASYRIAEASPPPGAEVTLRFWLNGFSVTRTGTVLGPAKNSVLFSAFIAHNGADPAAFYITSSPVPEGASGSPVYLNGEIVGMTVISNTAPNVWMSAHVRPEKMREFLKGCPRGNGPH